MSRFTDYQAVVDVGGGYLTWLVQLIDITGASHVVRWSNQDFEIGDGSVVKEWQPQIDALSLQVTGVSQRTLTMRFAVAPEDYPLIPHASTDPLHPSSEWKVRFWAAYTKEIPTGSEPFAMVCTMLPDEVTVTDDGGGGALQIEVDLIDMMRPLRSDFTAPYSWDVGEAADVAGAIMRQVMGDTGAGPAFLLNAVGQSVAAGNAGPGDSRLSVVSQLLQAVGQELWVDPQGVISNREIPDSICGTGEHWRYGQADGIPWQKASKLTVPNTPVGVRIEAGNYEAWEPPIIWTVYDLDATSEGYWQGSANAFPVLRNPYIQNLATAQIAGYARLRRIGTGPGVVKFTCLPNPAMLENDDIELLAPNLGINGLYRVMGMDLPLMPNNRMEVTCRASWNPRQGVPFVNDPGAASIFDLSAVFTGSGALPPEWSVPKGSWAQLGLSAYGTGGDNLAIYNDVLAGSDQQATAFIGNITNHVGVVIRSDGSASGIVGMLYPNGNAQIELWQNGVPVKTLATGTYTVGASVTEVVASGNTVSLIVNGSTVASVTDGATQTGGTLVGMFAAGTAAGSGPGISSFSASAP